MKLTKKLMIVLLCVVFATSAAVFASCDVTPEEPPVEKTISLDKTECTVSVDEELYLTVTTDAKGTLTWSSSDPKVASVDSSGRILTKKVGTTTITVSIEDISASCTLTVVESTGENGEKLLVDENLLLSLKDGAVTLDVQYFEDGSDSASTDKTINYRSADESVVTVSADGIVTPVSLGQTTIVVQCEGISVSVLADVYTASISTPAEWLEMIENSGHYSDKITTTERFYLKNDIDFTDVTYDIGPVAYGANSENDNAYHFCSELNGNYHTVKNITAWAEDSQLNPENHQSIFGRTVGATVKNVAFQNVVFNSTNSFGLCASLLHHFSDMEGVDAISNLFENISADFTYDFDASSEKGSIATGITRSAYGVNLKNVFVYMHAADEEQLLTDKYNNVYGFAQAEWVWYGGSLSNVIVLMDVPAENVQFINDAAGDQIYKHSKNNCYATNSVVQAAYFANKCFNQAVWDVTAPDKIPSFVK